MTPLWCWVRWKYFEYKKIRVFYFSGEHDLTNDSETVTFQSKIAGVGISHPRFYYRISVGVLNFDVGILTLETPIDFRNETYSHIR